MTLRWLPAVTWTLATAYSELVIRRREDREHEGTEPAADWQTRWPRSRLIKVVRFVLALVLLPMSLVLAALCGGWHYDGRVFVWLYRQGHLPRPTWAGVSRVGALVGALVLLVIASAALNVPVGLVRLELFGPVVLGATVLAVSTCKHGIPGYAARADWTIASAASRRRYGGLSIIARHVETLVDPAESIAATAASEKHADIYRRFGFQDVPGRPLQLLRPGKTTPAT